jgi:hypothetical protein
VETRARKEKEVKESHDRLLIVKGILAGSNYNWTKDAVVRLIKKDSLLDLQLLGKHGLKPPGSYTRKEFYHAVIDAIDRFDEAWRKTYGGGLAPGLSGLTEEKAEALQAEQKRQENVAASFEGLQAVESSVTGGAAAWGATFFTKDIKKIAAAGEAGQSIGGILTSVGAGKAKQIEQRAASALTEKNGPPHAAEIAPKSQSEPAPTPDLSVPAATKAPIPYVRGGPLEKTQPEMAFEKTEPGVPPQLGPPTEKSIPPGGRGSGSSREPRRQATIPGYPPRMPSRPPPARPIISWFPRQNAVPMSPEDVLRVLEIDYTRVIWSYNKGNNMTEWSAAGGKGLPPLAFTTDGKVRVDHDRWIEMGYPEHR